MSQGDQPPIDPVPFDSLLRGAEFVIDRMPFQAIIERLVFVQPSLDDPAAVPVGPRQTLHPLGRSGALEDFAKMVDKRADSLGLTTLLE